MHAGIGATVQLNPTGHCRPTGCSTMLGTLTGLVLASRGWQGGSDKLLACTSLRSQAGCSSPSSRCWRAA